MEIPEINGKTISYAELIKETVQQSKNIRVWFTDGSHIIIWGCAYTTGGGIIPCDVDYQCWTKDEWEDYKKKMNTE